MINHLVANEIKTSKELNVYLLENLEVGDTVIGPGKREYRILAIHSAIGLHSRVFYWTQDEDNAPITLGVFDMDSNHKVVAFCIARSEYINCDHTECVGGAVRSNHA